MFRIALGTICLAAMIACAPKHPITESSPSASMVNGTVVHRPSDISRSVVALVMAGQKGQSLCSGTILDERTILTAAHCVDHSPRELIVVFGPVVQTSKPEMRRQAIAAVQHPQWKYGQRMGDIALVSFRGGLPEGFTPVTLAGPSFPLSFRRDLFMIGYGISNPARQGGGGILRQTHSAVVGLERPDQIVVDERLSGACFGDSGGPAFARLDDQVVQVGLAHSVMNQSCDMASFYTGVMLYSDWIVAAARSLRVPGSETGARRVSRGI